MKFYIGQDCGSGIECNDWQEFVDYLHEECITREENGEEYFSITIQEE